MMRSLVVFAFFAAATLAPAQNTPRELGVVAGKSLVVDSPVDIIRVAVADPDIVEAVGVSPREVLLNGHKAGQTSVVLWQKSGARLLFDITVSPAPNQRLEAVRRELARELSGQDVTVSLEGPDVYLRGTVNDMGAADRAAAIASTLGKTINLLRVNVPVAEPQILLRVRFADVERSAAQELGANFFSLNENMIGGVSTGQFTKPTLSVDASGKGSVSLSDALNVFLFRPNLDIGATIKMLQQRKLVEILAEPNVLAANGKEASFLAGGEYPYPVPQGGYGSSPTITIRFKEFGIRLNFTPTITSRGTIRLVVEPEVSALDYSNGLTYQGFTVPGLTTRRVSTEIELQDQQSFAIAGLLDNRVTETLSKIPGLANIPYLGKLFQSRELNKNKTELLVLVTPEIVQPVPAGQPVPALEFPQRFIKEGATSAPRTPGGLPAVALPSRPAVAVEALREEKRKEDEQRERRSGASSGSSDTDRMGSTSIRQKN